MAEPGLGEMTRKQIPAQLQEELSNNLSCLTICLLRKGGSRQPLVVFKPRQARLQPEAAVASLLGVGLTQGTSTFLSQLLRFQRQE